MTMKKITLVAALLTLSLGFGCQDRHGKQQAKAAGNANALEVFSADDVWEVPVASDIDFEQAIDAYQAGDYQYAAKHIEQGITALKNETKDNTGTLRNDTQAMIKELHTLADRLRKGEVKSAGELQKDFTRAGLLVSHSYLILSNYYLVDNSVNEASLRMSAALTSLENAVKHGDDRLKAEAKPLIEESRQLIHTEEQKGRLDLASLKKQSEKLIDFLEVHAAGN